MGEDNCNSSGSELPYTVAQVVHCTALGSRDAVFVITVWDTLSKGQ